MNIDSQSGTVELPNGYSIDSNLTQAGFRAGEMFPVSTISAGAATWLHFNFPGGTVDGKQLLVSICFQGESLDHLTISADLYPPGPKDWSNYSLSVEAAIKGFHDDLLTRILGQPTQSDRLSIGDATTAQTTLGCSNTWAFSWGTVHSGHDSKGGGTYITVRYSSRV